MKNNEMIGKKFNRWTVLKITNKRNKQGYVMCLSRCECGTERLVNASRIRNNQSKSCGCLAISKNIKRNETHKQSKHPLYPRWNAMKRRCYNKTDSRYEYYGEKGIIMCDEWKNNPKNFYDWYESQGGDLNLTVDRIDTYGNYSPENCRLITLEEQQRNKRPQKNGLSKSQVIKIREMLSDGIPVTEISKKTKSHRGTIHRIKKGKAYKNVR